MNPSSRSDGKPGKPNILLIMTDQMRSDWISCAGTSYVDTPHIDRLAQEGVRFTRATCTSPLCAPSRVSLASGLYPHRLGVLDNFGDLQADQPTYYQKLRQAGYRVGVVGKTDLHKTEHYLGVNGDLPAMYHFGFTDPCETEGKLNAAWESHRKHPDPSQASLAGPYQHYLHEKGLLEAFMKDFRYRASEVPVWHAHPSVLPAEHFHDSFIGRKSCEFLESVSDESPWHLFVSFVGPHDPWDAPDEYVRRYADKEYDGTVSELSDDKPAFIHAMRKRQSNGMTPKDLANVKRHYAGAIKLIDDWIGRMLDILEERGLRENTIVVFCADHGEMLGDHGLFLKKVMYEGAVRIPLIVSQPGGSRGVTSDALAELVDLHPTMLEWAGVRGGSELCDGLSLAPVLENPSSKHKSFQVSVVNNTRMIYDGRYKLIENYNDTFELYDLQEDPAENHNLYRGKPQVAGSLHREMRAILK